MGRSLKYAAGAAAVVFALLALSAIVRFTGREERRVRMIYIPKVIDENNDFWTQLMEGVDMAAEEYGVDLTVVAPDTEENYRRQNELIAWAIEQKPDAIVLCPSRYTETTSMAEKIVENGIRLVLVDSALDRDIADSLIATDNVKAGAQQGAFIRERIRESGEDGKIAVVAHVEGSSTAMEREQGLRQGLSEYEDRIVDVVFSNSDYEKAYESMVKLIREHPDIRIVVGTNEYSAVGAARAVKDLGLADQIRMIGFDSSLEEIQLLEEGVLRAIVIQMPFKMGYMGVEAAYKLARGEKVLKKIDSGCELITIENMYIEENQKLLFPFRGE